MNKEKKDWKSLNCRLDKKMYDRLCKYAELKGQTLTKAVERLIDYNIDEDGNSKAQTNKTA